MLFDLPTELLRVVLEHLSLKDIARLQISASNPFTQVLLTQALKGLCIKKVLCKSYLSWLIKYNVNASNLAIGHAVVTHYNMSYVEKHNPRIIQLMLFYNLMNYTLEEISCFIQRIPREYVTTLEVTAVDGFLSRDLFPLLSSLPIRNICIHTDFTAGNNDLTFKTLIRYFPQLESIQCYMETSMSTEETAVFDTIKRLRLAHKDVIKHYFPNLQKLSGCHFELTLENAKMLSARCPRIEDVDVNIGSSGLQGLQFLLQALPTVRSLTMNMLTNAVVELPFTPNTYSHLQCVSVSIVTSPAIVTFISKCCPNVSNLDIFISVIDEKIVRDIGSLRHLSRLCVTYDDFSCELLFHLLQCGHNELSTICVKFNRKYAPVSTLSACDDHSSVISAVPKLHTIQGIHHISRSTYAILKQCPALKRVTVNDISGDVDIETLYVSCPHLKSIEYSRGSYGFKLFQYSHEKLESITIAGYWGCQKPKLKSKISSFPSLRALTIYDSDILEDIATMASFKIEWLTVTKTISDITAFLDCFRYYSSLSRLEYVFCRKKYCDLCSMSEQMKRQIQFKSLTWLA